MLPLILLPFNEEHADATMEFTEEAPIAELDMAEEAEDATVRSEK